MERNDVLEREIRLLAIARKELNEKIVRHLDLSSKTEEGEAICAICGRIARLLDAIEEGWIPTYYSGDIELGPACPECVDSSLLRGIHGEYIRRGDF